MNNTARIVALGFLVLMLASCDSGGSNTPTEKTFSISLENVDIRRVSNGETVALDTSEINSGQMTFK